MVQKKKMMIIRVYTHTHAHTESMCGKMLIMRESNV